MENRQPDAITLEAAGSSGIEKPFLGLFGKGVFLDGTVGCSIRDLLCGQYAVAGDYLDNRVQTVFLNGKAVDDVDQSMVTDGAVLALSAAMPGLAGATLRKGGHLAAMRSQISHAKEAACTAGGMGRITLKLFNLVLRELGPHFLAIGVRCRGEAIHAIFREIGEDWWEGCTRMVVNGEPTDRERMAEIDWAAAVVLLKIHPE